MTWRILKNSKIFFFSAVKERSDLPLIHWLSGLRGCHQISLYKHQLMPEQSFHILSNLTGSPCSNIFNVEIPNFWRQPIPFRQSKCFKRFFLIWKQNWPHGNFHLQSLVLPSEVTQNKCALNREQVLTMWNWLTSTNSIQNRVKDDFRATNPETKRMMTLEGETSFGKRWSQFWIQYLKRRWSCMWKCLVSS